MARISQIDQRVPFHREPLNPALMALVTMVNGIAGVLLGDKIMRRVVLGEDLASLSARAAASLIGGMSSALFTMTVYRLFSVQKMFATIGITTLMAGSCMVSAQAWQWFES